MSVYAKVGPLIIQVTTDFKTVTPFDHVPCKFDGYAMLDNKELHSGAKEALLAINDTETHIGPFDFRFSAFDSLNTPVNYREVEVGTIPIGNRVIRFAPRLQDRAGLCLPFAIFVPPMLWPTVDNVKAYTLSVSIHIEFIERGSGKVERIRRDASVTLRIKTLSPPPP